MAYKFRIPCFWSMAGIYEIEADSLEEARQIAMDKELPDGEYIDGSFEINEDFLDEEPQNRISLELIKVDKAEKKELPLMLGTLKTSEAQTRLEERLKGA